MWPSVVAMDLVRYRLTLWTVNWGQVAKWPFWIALIRVEVAGLKQLACRKLIRSAIVLLLVASIAALMLG